MLLLVGVPDNLKAPVEKLFPQPEEQPVAVDRAVGDPRLVFQGIRLPDQLRE